MTDSDDAVRQYAPIYSLITPHHVKRYQFAASLIPAGAKVIDAACGCGYGTKILHDSGANAIGIDVSDQALSWAMRYFPGPRYICADVQHLESAEADVLVSMETIEHIREPERLLKTQAKMLIASVPNQLEYPFDPENFKGDSFPHLRHYMPDEFTELLNSCGWAVDGRYKQEHKGSGIQPGVKGRFLIYVAFR